MDDDDPANDWGAKLLRREVGRDPFHGKTVRKVHYPSQNISIYSRDKPGFISEFEQILKETAPGLMNKCLKTGVYDVITMNDAFLFTELENVLQSLAVRVSTRKMPRRWTRAFPTYGKVCKVYSLPVTADIRKHDNTVIPKKNILFKGHTYSPDFVYDYVQSTGTLKIFCECVAPIPACLPLNIVPIRSRCEIYSQNNKKIESLRYTRDNFTSVSTHETYDELISRYPGCGKRVVKQPVSIRMHCEEKSTVTHIGFLAYTPRVRTSDALHILSRNYRLEFTKFEIWYRSSRDKRWCFLKHAILKNKGIHPHLDEQIISISDNFQSLEGISTTEFKIVPHQSVENLFGRCFLYGRKHEDKQEKKLCEKIDTIDYTVEHQKSLRYEQRDPRGGRRHRDIIPKSTRKADLANNERF